MATKDEILYEALLRISGGKYTDDVSVRYGEAEVYLASAVNYVQLGNYWIEGKAEQEHAVNPMMLSAFDNVPILYSTIRKRYYVTLPARVVPLPKGRSLSITTECGKTFIPLVPGDEEMQQYYADFDDNIKYLPEGTVTVWLYGMDKYPLIKYCRPRYIVNVRDLPGTAEILLPANGEKDVLDLMVGWLGNERIAPKDYSETGKDNVKVQ